VRTANIGVGDVVAVVGLVLSDSWLPNSRASGGVVVAIDLKADRVELARRLGFGLCVRRGRFYDPGCSRDHLRPRGDVVIVAAASKSAAPARQALDLCRDRGRLVIVGAVELNLPWHEMYLKEIQLFMSRAYGPGSYDTEYERQARDYPFAYVRWTENRNMEEFLRLVASARVELEPLITHQFDLEESAAAYQTILDPSTNSLAVLLRYREAGIR